MSKGTKEKVQLILVMSREAKLYLLDEPIGGVDPASRDYILDTIISNYKEDATVIISTHLISDIEKVLDHVIFINKGQIVLSSPADEIRNEKGKSVDALFREVFKC
jgi:ABC-2 type transport system ATP-binding protein